MRGQLNAVRHGATLLDALGLGVFEQQAHDFLQIGPQLVEQGALTVRACRP